MEDAIDFYEFGADYVVLPHFLGGEFLANIIEKSGNSRREYQKRRRKHLKDLNERMKRGHKHPKFERG